MPIVIMDMGTTKLIPNIIVHPTRTEQKTFVLTEQWCQYAYLFCGTCVTDYLQLIISVTTEARRKFYK